MAKIDDIAYVTYTCPDLDLAERFFADFGMVRAAAPAPTVEAPAAGPSPAVPPPSTPPPGTPPGAAPVSGLSILVKALRALIGDWLKRLFAGNTTR